MNSRKRGKGKVVANIITPMHNENRKCLTRTSRAEYTNSMIDIMTM